MESFKVDLKAIGDQPLALSLHADDAFFEAISAPVEAHTITLPYGQGTITYQAMVSAGEDKQRDKVAGVTRWTGLTVTFTAKKPQRRPT